MSDKQGMNRVSRPSGVVQTLQRHWTGKRLLVLAIFALAWGNVVCYSVGFFARRNFLETVVNQHQKTYSNFIQTLDRSDSNDEAIGEIQRQFPQYKIEVIENESAVGSDEKEVLTFLKNRPKGWRHTEEVDGWARSFFVMPQSNDEESLTAFRVVSYVRDDLQNWQKLAINLGIYSFFFFVLFGWFWSRAVDFTAQKSLEEEQRRVGEISQKLVALNRIAEEIGKVVGELRVAVQRVEVLAGGSQTGVVHALEEISGQIRLLALNAAVEASRSPESYRVFGVLTQEISALSERSRELLTKIGSRGYDMSVVRQKLERVDAIMSSLTNFEPEPSDASLLSKQRAS